VNGFAVLLEILKLKTRIIHILTTQKNYKVYHFFVFDIIFWW